MTLDPKPAKSYQAHRENQREWILEVAERLFISAGIDGVSLSDIARAARLTRNTVYEYFPNKQEVAWAILQKIFAQGRAEPAAKAQGSAFQRIEQFMQGMVRRLETHPEHARFIVEFNSLYAREASAARMRQATEQTHAEADDPLAGLLRQGIADGSLRADLDPDLYSAAIWNLLSGMNARFALLGDLIAQEYNQSSIKIYQEIIRAFLRGIHAESDQSTSQTVISQPVNQ